MYARSLEDILSRLFEKGDLGQEDYKSFEDRFRALRGCALLPRGRDNRGRRLTDVEIVHAVLGSIALQPAQAGFTAIMLSKLVPAGGIDASFHQAASLVDAIKTFVTDKEARDRLIHLTLSTAEGGVNSHGYADLLFKNADGVVQRVHFASEFATSITGLGGEKRVRPEHRYSPASRETVLSPSFFEKLARENEAWRMVPEPPGDGREYTVEEAEEERRHRLGVRRGASYLNIGVDSHVTWPKEERLVTFGDYEFVLMPRTKDKAASIHIDLNRYRLSHEEARTLVNRLVSLMSWVDDQYVIVQDGWSGSHTRRLLRERNSPSL